MLEHNTLDQLRALKLHGFADALEEQLRQPNIHAMSFEERLALLVDREVNLRSERKQTRLLQNAQLKFPRAAIEDFDNRTGRGIERKAFMSLALSHWITQGDTILLTGATGVGKSWLACALAQYACRRGHSALYLRVPRLAEQLRVLHGSGGFGKWLVQLAKTEVLILDDWGVASLDPSTRSDLLEIIDDRAAHTRPPSSPPSSRSSTGMRGSGMPPSPMPSSIGSYSACTASSLPASPSEGP